LAIATNLGFPRIGAKRELKRAVERLWSGKTDLEEMLSAASDIRRGNWLLQKEIGIEHIPSNDFSLYDHVLDTIAMVGAVPERYGWDGGEISAELYFAMARGTAETPAMEMTKWFDTNYHYIVPEFKADQEFQLSSNKPFAEFSEALSLGILTRPVLLGPVSFLLLGKVINGGGSALSLLDRLLPIYGEVLGKLAEAGAEWIQIDEPILALDLPEGAAPAFKKAYSFLADAAGNLRICMTAYFSDLKSNAELALKLPVTALHLDLVRGPQQLERLISHVPQDKSLSLGLIDGRNVWLADLDAVLSKIEKAVSVIGPERVMIAPSCSLLHCPIDLDSEAELDTELRGWMAFAKQKLEEIAILTRAINNGRSSVESELKDNREKLHSRSKSPRTHNKAVRHRMASISERLMRRESPYGKRRERQRETTNLPLLPTTTIGSYPQTAEIRQARADFRKGKLTAEQYGSFLKKQIEETIRFQENTGLDVLVHGEFERNDMVEYFGEQMEGIAFTQHGWVQSYGSRYVKPPIIYGDVSRPVPMTVEWIKYAQSLTKRPLKGMLTGPVTILQWSFVRDDQLRRDTAYQIALAIRDEVADLEAAGIKVIQIDEPAFREGLPLRREEWAEYLEWAVNAFRLASSVAKDSTQIHTHMCYSEFNEFIEQIAALDADVISIEASRSNMELLDAFAEFEYPNEIGPGVYDIHSPRVPPKDEIKKRLKKALEVLRPEQLWVNPDCGLKTRDWPEVTESLRNMVAAAMELRATL
jgi:5-methyltetrahydropteroyltriglutamate--homocysteine methyltransferase